MLYERTTDGIVPSADGIVDLLLDEDRRAVVTRWRASRIKSKDPDFALCLPFAVNYGPVKNDGAPLVRSAFIDDENTTLYVIDHDNSLRGTPFKRRPIQLFYDYGKIAPYGDFLFCGEISDVIREFARRGSRVLTPSTFPQRGI